MTLGNHRHDDAHAPTDDAAKENTSAPATSVRISPEAPGFVVLAPSPTWLDQGIGAARDWLLGAQHAEGWWCGELDGDTTLESYAILLRAFLGRRDDPAIPRLARTIRADVLPGGGWSQYARGGPDLSVSCLSYFALKVAGGDAGAPHMRSSREVILSLGGAGRANTYTRYHLAMFGQLGWAEVPAMPPEMALLPPRAPFSVFDMSSWSRTIFVPLSIVYAHRPCVRLPPSCDVGELFVGGRRVSVGPSGPERWLLSPHVRWRWLFQAIDRGLKAAEHLPGAARLRAKAVDRAAAWIRQRLTGADGLGAILPAMANTVLALRCMGVPDDAPEMVEAIAALDRLLLEDPATGDLRMQPCVSPVWDTCLAAYALAETDLRPEHPALARAAAWLLTRQCRRPGDWAVRNPAAPGGWYFEHANEPYPDVDDTAMALMVLARARAQDRPDQAAAMGRGLRWMLGMQNADGGWASFDRDNHKEWLTHVPFADHNAMIDPSTADITGRVLECLGRLGGFDAMSAVVRRAIAFLRANQDTDGSWYGRWGVNYIYGTSQVLRGLRAVGTDMAAPWIQRAARWLLSIQNADGGWGESIASYDDPANHKGRGDTTPSQTAWAVMGLMAAGLGQSQAVRRGVRHLLETQTADGTWQQEAWTGTGFPRVFYLNYALYRHYFPLMALARYRATQRS